MSVKHLRHQLHAAYVDFLQSIGARRLARLVGALLVIAVLFVPTLSIIARQQQYVLDASTRRLLGTANSNLAAKFSYDDQRAAWLFNADGIADDSATTPIAALKAQVGGAGKDDNSLYSASLATDPKKGVTYYDNNLRLSFGVIPQFRVDSGQAQNGRLVYPFQGGGKLVYTAMSNGMKEDIVLPKSVGNDLEFTYKLKLPKELTARIQDDGSVGVFSADPVLFGNMAFGGTSDRAKVESARLSAPKNHLVFALPPPVIKESSSAAGGTPAAAHGHFVLNGDQLKVVVSGMDDLRYPVTVDPSVVVTSSSDFASGNDEGMIDYNTAGQVTRGSLTGGTVGAWQTTTPLPDAREQGNTVVYNGYIYILGGVLKSTGSATADVQYASIGSDGTLGAWQTASLGAYNTSFGAVVYNGYLYILGGYSGGRDVVQYAALNTDGSIGSWQTGTSLPAANTAIATAVYNGYIYLVGGGPSGGSGTYYNTVYYSAIRADGSIGSWTPTTSLPAAIGMENVVAYNGYLYLLGGASSGFNTIAYNIAIHSDGTLGSSWNVVNGPTNPRYGGLDYADNGYIYHVAGWNNSGVTQYAPILADGTLGTWRSTSSFDSAAGNLYVYGAAHNGYLYVISGRNQASGSGSTYDVPEVEYAKIDPPGTTGAWKTTTAYHASGTGWPGQTTGAGCIAYNGYIYMMGGYANGSGGYTNLVQYAPLGSDGTIGTWAATTALNEATGSVGAALYNGYIYIIGGYTSGTTSLANVQYAKVNADHTLGSWSEGTPLANGIANQPAAAYGGYLYTLGTNGSGPSSIVQYAKINSDGSIGSWQSSPNQLQTARQLSSLIAVGGYMYVVSGGLSSSTPTASVEYTAINSDGTLGAWQSATSLNHGRFLQGGFAYNGYLYQIGGEDATGDLATAERASINADGTLGAWVYDTTLPATDRSAGVVTYNGYAYMISGVVGGSRSLNTYYAPIANGGTGRLGTWTDGGNSMPSQASWPASVIYNGYLYSIGGSVTPASNEVRYAKLSDDGSVGTWTTDSHLLPNNRQQLGVAAYNGYLYVLGGQGTTFYKDILYAPIGADGSLTGNLTAAGGNVSNGGAGVKLVAYGGYLYSVGGWDGSTDWNTVQYAKINGDGTIGNWTNASSFTNGRSNGGALAYNGYLYLIGGNGSTDYNDVQYAKINGDGTLGTWTYTTSFVTPRVDFVFGAYNGYLYISGGDSTPNPTRTYYSDTQYAAINSNGTIGDWQAITGTGSDVPTGFKDSSAQAVYNGYIYSVGGAYTTSDQATVQYASLKSIARVGHYSKIVNLGGAYNVTGVSYSGLLPGGDAMVTYRAAASDGAFGASGQTSTVVGSGGCVGNLGNTQYLLIRVTLDDSYGQGAAGAFPDTNGTNANLSDVTVNYVPAHPSPDIRLHGGKTLQNGVLSPLDTCHP